MADLCGLTLRFLHCGVLRFVIAACRVMRFIQSVISLKRSRVRAYSTVMRGSSFLLSLKYIWCMQKSPQRRICLKPTVTMFWRFAMPCLIFYSGPCLILYSLLGLGLRYCAGYIFTVFCGPYGNLRQIKMPPYRCTTAVRKTQLICL